MQKHFVKVCKKYTIKQISIDHKPEVKEEGERIIRYNGRLESYKGKILI